MKIISTEIKNLDPIKTIALEHVGAYSGAGAAFEKLCIWAEANNLWANEPKMAGVYHDDPSNTPTEKLRSKACIEDLSGVTPSEEMQHYTISGGKYFVMQVELTMPECWEAWQKAYATFNEKGCEYDLRDHYDIYLACTGDMNDPNAPWIVNMCIPTK